MNNDYFHTPEPMEPEHTAPVSQDFSQTGTYQTGSTRPPKSRGGLIAFLLVVIILLCGAVTILGLMNIKLFRQLDGTEETLGISLDENERASGTIPFHTSSGENTQQQAHTIQAATSPVSQDNIPSGGSMSLQDIYARTIDAVVSISCTYPGGSSTGTGVVLTEDGYIVTNCHVVEGAQIIQIRFHNETVLEAQLVGADAISDLAVLRVDASDLPFAQLGDSSVLRVGDAVVAIGDPLGIEYRGTMTDGIVSAINRNVNVDGRTMNLIQTNAALNSGNSGGPLLNCYGQVIGINTMKIGDYMHAGGVEGLGFAIPSTTVEEVVNQLIAQGYVSGRPTLGISGEDVSSFYQFYYNLPAGLYITQVDEDSSSAQAGIQAGDILLSIGQTRIYGADSYESALYGYTPGDRVQVVIYRNYQQYSATITVDESGK